MQDKSPESRYRIRFKDCDPLGHLYNTRYLDYLLEAREDHILDHYNLNLENYASESGMAWVVVHHEIAYLAEAKRNEYIRIRSSMIYYDDKKIINEYQMWNDDFSRLKCLMHTSFLHVDIQLKKVAPHGENIQTLLSSILLENTSSNFRERQKELLTKV
ncbi:MAG: acyl-CoA thioesterase [Saprospiraceae bacterium]